MRVWLITIGEPLPTDPGNPRLHRTGINADYLTSRGHEIVFWTGTFDHFTKSERTGHDIELHPAPNYTIVGMYAGTYSGNVSLKRIRYHRALAPRFRKLVEAGKYPHPDVIVVSLTPLELAREAVNYGHKWNIPVIVDVRDLWPDVWLDRLPSFVRPLRHILFKTFYDDLKKAIRGATAIIGITDTIVDWAMAVGGRKRDRLDRGFPIVYTTRPPAPADVAAARERWRAMGIGTSPNEIIGCFFGNMSHRPEFDTPLRAVAEMPEDLRSRIKLVMCGRGENQALIESYAAKTPQIVYNGWADAPQIRALMEISHFGLLPYPPDFDFQMSLPNKVSEYLSGGLPIVTSLPGETEKLFSSYSCGVLYKSGDPGTFQAVMHSFVSDPGRLAALAQGARAAGAARDATANSGNFEEYLMGIVAQAR